MYSLHPRAMSVAPPLTWDEFFMSSASLAAKRSKDPVTKVGAVIVNGENRIVGTGYNGFPRGVPDDVELWGKDDDVFLNKHSYVIHAELNAILNASEVAGCTMYVTLFPCNECAKVISQMRIKRVVYLSSRERDCYKISRYILAQGEVETIKYSI